MMINKLPFKHLFSIREAFALLAVIFLVGFSWIITQQAKNEADINLRHTALDQAESISQTISPNLVKALSFSTADRERPEFWRIGQHMMAYAKFAHLRSVYSVASKNNILYFGPESLDGKDPLASPPGTVYKKPNAELINIFKNKKSLVVGPYSDEYGTFISAFSPLLSPLSGEVLLVVGVDIPIEQWQSALMSAQLKTFVPLAVLTAIFILIFVFLLWAHTQAPWKNSLWLRYEDALYVVLFGLSLTVFGSLSTYNTTKKNDESTFSFITDAKMADLTDRFSNAQQLVAALASFFESSKFITSSEFAKFSSALAQSSAIRALAWAPATIPKISPLKKVYYPITYIAPIQNPIFPLGFDLANDPIELSAIQDAIKYKLPTVSDLITIPTKNQTQKSIALIYPVIKQSSKKTNISGIAVGIINIQALINEIFETSDKEEKIKIEVLNISQYDTQTSLASIPEQSITLDNSKKRSWHSKTYPLFFGKKTYAVIFWDENNTQFQSPLVAGFITFFAGIFLTGLIAAFIIVLSRKRENLEYVVEKRTDELQKSKTKIESIIKALHVGLFIVDMETHTIKAVNPAAAKLIGLPMEEIIGKNCHLFVCPATEGDCPITDKGMHVENAEKILLCHNKTGIPILKTITPIMFAEKQCLLETFVDISLQKQTESTLLETNRRLEQATTAKSEFLANMSHEIRTPMNGVIGMAQLLLGTELNTTQRRYVETICSSGDSLLILINDILDYSKIEANKLTLESINFNLNYLLNSVSLLFATSAHQKGLEFICTIDSNIPHNLRGDSYRLRQIMNNLLGNAIKFTSKGKISIRASLVAETDKNVLLRFLISDTGIGIPPERIELLFQKFSQVDKSTTRKYGGTGLGLAISKQLAEMMDGAIGVESQQGHGSEFWFTALLAKQTLPTINKCVVIPKELSCETKILLVEDNETNQAVAMAIFDKFGINADLVINGVKAIEALSNTNYDLVLMDIQMPEMDGYEATRQIRDPLSAVKNHQVPIIAMTAHILKEDQQKCIDAGMNDYIAKPISILHMIKTLQKWIQLDLSDAELSESVAIPQNVEFDIKIFNPNSLLARVQGNQKIAKRVIEVFLQDSQSRLNDLHNHIIAGNAKNTEIAAHAIKGAAASASGEEVLKIAQEMEMNAKAENLTKVANLMHDLQIAMQRLQEAMQQWSNS